MRGFGSPPQIEKFYLHLKVLIQSIYNAYTLCEHSKESCKLIINITNMREMTNITKKTKIMTISIDSNTLHILQFNLDALTVKEICDNHFFQALALSNLSTSTNSPKPLNPKLKF